MVSNRIHVDGPRASTVELARTYKHDPHFWSGIVQPSDNGNRSDNWLTGCGCLVLVNVVLMVAVGVIGFLLGAQFGG